MNNLVIYYPRVINLKYEITRNQKEELEAARKKNKNKHVENRLRVLVMRAEGRRQEEIAEATGFSRSYVNRLIANYCKNGLSAIVDNHYSGNRRNMSIAEEAELLEKFRQRAEAGQVVDTREIKEAYEQKVGHSIGGSQIYYVLHRHGWRKVMPRSKHPNKANEEVISTSKKLTHESKN